MYSMHTHYIHAIQNSHNSTLIQFILEIRSFWRFAIWKCLQHKMSEALAAHMGEGTLCPLPGGYKNLHSALEPEVLRAIIFLSKDCWKLSHIAGLSDEMTESSDCASLCGVEDPGPLQFYPKQNLLWWGYLCECVPWVFSMSVVSSHSSSCSG